MTLTEAVKAWSDATLDAWAFEAIGWVAKADEARHRARKLHPLLMALVAQGEAAIDECDIARDWSLPDEMRGSTEDAKASYDVAKEAVRKMEEQT